MHEELNQFVRNDVWELAPRSENVHVIGTKWIFKNKTESSNSVKYTMNVQTLKNKITNSSFMTNTKCAENEYKL